MAFINLPQVDLPKVTNQEFLLKIITRALHLSQVDQKLQAKLQLVFKAAVISI